MKFQKIITLTLSCLLLLETPFTSLASSPFPSSSEMSASAESADNLHKNFEENKGVSLTPVLNYTSYTLAVGGRLQLTASGTSADIVWSSDHPDIVSVTSSGAVTAHKSGFAAITASVTVNDGKNKVTNSATCKITVTDTVSIEQTNLTLYTCKSGHLDVATSSAGAVSWKSSNTAVATVDSKGNIHPKKAGTTTITASVNQTSDSCQVTVKNPSMKLQSKATVYLHNPVSLDADAVPESPVSWKSSDSKIAKVNAQGKVTPKKPGTVTITASCNGLKRKCKITVKKPSVKLNKETALLFTENTFRLKASAKPSDKIKWTSSDSKIASVSADGTITGKKAGTVTITASVPGAESSCQATILKNQHKLNRSSQILMQGNSTTLFLSNVSPSDSVSFQLEKSSAKTVEISSSGNSCKVTAKKPGTATVKVLCSTTVNGQRVTASYPCTITVIKNGIKQQQTALAVNCKKTLSLKNVKKTGTRIIKTVWSSSNSKIASVDSVKGIVTGKRTGSAKITAEVSYSDGTSSTFATNVKVSNPKTDSSYTVLSLGKSQKIKLKGTTSFSNVTWSVKDSSLASITQDGTVTAGSAPGKTTVFIEADGKKIKHQLIITNPQLKTSHTTLAVGKKIKPPVTGASSKSKITCRSKKSSIAKIDKSGRIVGRSCGNTEVIVTVDDVSFTLQISVAADRALKACKKGYKIINRSRYSQARRMSNGYYDCSSLVFRSYDCDSKLLGGFSFWAPTAASMAAHLERKGKVISYKGIDSSKLVPGDLIFYRKPNGRNGRYKNIYHVSMYYGNGFRLEKPLRTYYRERNIVMIARPLKK